jgi:transcriptional regulator with XRE-family HTH domain
MATKKKSEARKFLEKISEGSLTIGDAIEAYRLGEELTQIEFAKILGISASHLCDIEKGRKLVSPERAAKYAKTIGRSPELFVMLSLQEILNKSGLKMTVTVA